MSQVRRLSEVRVKLERVPPGERAVPEDYPDSLGLRTKFGGAPDWIQYEEEVSCSICSQPMVFVGQIDSFDFDGKNNPMSRPYGEAEYMFSDVGMIYVFYCFKCSEPVCRHQYY